MSKAAEVLDRNDNIKVAVRVRPMLPHEMEFPPALKVMDSSSIKVRVLSMAHRQPLCTNGVQSVCPLFSV